MHMYNVCVNESSVTQAHSSDAVQMIILIPQTGSGGGGVWGWTTGYQPYAGHRGLFISPRHTSDRNILVSDIRQASGRHRQAQGIS